jgi:O-acetyl-ADP-ribose deacetylase (regulator of RNase III)
MRERYWNNTPNDPDRKERRMAECLVHGHVPWATFTQIVARAATCARTAHATLAGPRYVINFPTKTHWRARSKLESIEAGLVDLVRVIKELRIRSIALPPLGCGAGGLDWRDVEPQIRRALAAVDDVDVLLYPPGETPTAARMRTKQGTDPTRTTCDTYYG